MKLCFSKISWIVAASSGILGLYLVFPTLVKAQQSALTRSEVSPSPLSTKFPLTAPSALPGASTDFAIDSGYVLGAGDRIALDFFNVDEYDGEEIVSVDGSLVLPLIGKLPVSGLTLEETTQAISSAYSAYLKTSLVTIDLVAPRPIQIGIAGEVNKPGTYEVPFTGGTPGSMEWPTLIEAIKLAGGITNQANIRAVEIRRTQSGGRVQTIQLNLWELLQTGSVQSDITLRSGDAISIPTAASLSAGELTQLAAANFSPNSIKVTVVGEVTTPGPQEIDPNAPLNQALLAAGGFDPQRANQNTVELIRLNPDGTVSQRKIDVAFDQGINDATNPSMQDNDVVVVRRSGATKFSDGANSILGPLGRVLSPFGLIKGLFGF